MVKPFLMGTMIWQASLVIMVPYILWVLKDSFQRWV